LLGLAEERGKKIVEIESRLQRGKRIFKIVGIIVACILLLIIANFIPAWNLKTEGMQKLTGNNINVYYEKEEAAAEDVFELADAKAADISKKFGFTEKQQINIYIYDHQSTMQSKKYGYLGPMLNLDWYIGDNGGTNVILTSPANPGKVHDYNNNKNAALHEMVHAYISVLNPHIKLWLTEGTALYLTNANPFNKALIKDIPSYSDIQTRNPIKFSNMYGYDFANTYIEYLDNTYGWDKVLKLIKTEDYEGVFGKSSHEIYDEWVDYLKSNY
jgi:hypothetical protein